MSSLEVAAVGQRIKRARHDQEAGVANDIAQRILAVDGSRLRTLRIQRAVVSLVGAMYDAISVGDAALPSRARVTTLLSDNNDASFQSLRERQVALLELTLQFTRMNAETFGRVDVAAHLSLADGLLRYTSAWARFYELVARNYTSNVDLELIEATLGDVLSVASVGYAFHLTGLQDSGAMPTSSQSRHSMHSSAIADLAALRTLGSGTVATASYGSDFATALRSLIEVSLGLALSDAFLWLDVGTKSDADSVLAANSLTGGASVLLRWLDTTSLGAHHVRDALAPYLTLKHFIGEALSEATRYLLASPLASSPSVKVDDASNLLFALPMWQLLIVVRFVKMRVDASRKRDRDLGHSSRAQHENAHVYLRAEEPISPGDFGSSSDDEEQ